MSDKYPIKYVNVTDPTGKVHYTVRYFDRFGRRHSVMVGAIDLWRLEEGCDRLEADGMKNIQIIGLRHEWSEEG